MVSVGPVAGITPVVGTSVGAGLVLGDGFVDGFVDGDTDGDGVAVDEGDGETDEEPGDDGLALGLTATDGSGCSLPACWER